MELDIIGAESLGVRSLCCRIRAGDRRIVIDPGVALAPRRQGLEPHPIEIAAAHEVRAHIVAALGTATDVVFSHHHGDHVPLAQPDPSQLGFEHLPEVSPELKVWSKGPAGSKKTEGRFWDLENRFGHRFTVSEADEDGPLRFSVPRPHGEKDSPRGEVMMTRVETEHGIFVHASDIQLLDDSAVDCIVCWRPDVVLASGPPLYLSGLDAVARRRARENALRLARTALHVILDHHVMRDGSGVQWINQLSADTDGRVTCAADFMGRPRHILEGRRKELYAEMPSVANG